MSRKIVKLENVVGKKFIGYNLPPYKDEVALHFDDDVSVLVGIEIGYEVADAEIDLEPRIPHFEDLYQLGVVSEEEWQEHTQEITLMREKERERIRLKQIEEEYQKYLELRAKYEPES